MVIFRWIYERFEVRQVDPMRESFKFSSCRGHENYLKRALPFGRVLRAGDLEGIEGLCLSIDKQ